LRVASKLKVLLGDVVRRAANLHLGTVGFINARQRIVVMPASPAATAVMTLMIPIPPPHALVLTVSHDLPVANSCFRQFPRRFAEPIQAALLNRPRMSAR
jgi:hypothetical protein